MIHLIQELKSPKKVSSCCISRSGRQCQKQKKNRSKEGGRYYPYHRKVMNPYIFSKVRFQYCEKDENQIE